MDFVFEIDEAFVLLRNEGFEDIAQGHEAVSYGDLAFFVVEIGEVFHVDVMKARAGFADGLDDVGAGTNGVANIDAAADARI